MGNSESYSEPIQTSKTELFARTSESYYTLTEIKNQRIYKESKARTTTNKFFREKN